MSLAAAAVLRAEVLGQHVKQAIWNRKDRIVRSAKQSPLNALSPHHSGSSLPIGSPERLEVEVVDERSKLVEATQEIDDLRFRSN